MAVAALAFMAAPAHAQTVTSDDLARALKQRDAVIAALQARIEALERARTTAPPAMTAPSVVAATTPAAAPAAPTSEDDPALQALSRTLIERGSVLLPPGRVEIVPSAIYSNRIVQGLALVETPEGIPTVADQRLREDQLRGSLALRVGLPWSSQIEARLPYSWLRTDRALGDGSTVNNHGSGIGDAEVELSHQFLSEGGGHPAIVGGVSWRFPTGRDPFRVPVASVATGSGSDQVRARLTVTTSSDPLAFFGTVSYAHALAVKESFGRVQGGDSLGLDAGIALSLNPETSMTFGLSQEFGRRTKVDNVPTPGTDTVASSLSLGLGRLISPRLLLDVGLGVGLTHDAPDYVFLVSLPFRLR